MERFKTYVNLQEGWIILGKYVNNRTNILMSCPIGHQNEINPTNFLTGSRCRTCAGQDPKVIEQNFMKVLNEGNFKLNGTFNGVSKDVNLTCPCEHTFTVGARHFIKNGNCKVCIGKSIDGAKEKLNKRIKNSCWELIDDYVNMKTQVMVKCINNHVTKILPNDINENNRCKICSGCDSNSFEKLLNNEGWKMTGNYINSITKVEVQCNNNHIISITPSRFKSGKGCAKCSKQCPIQSENNFRDIAIQEEWEILTPYTGIDNHVSMKCPNGHIRNITPNNFKSGTRCLECKNSRGMTLLGKILNELNYKFSYEYNLQDKEYPKIRYDIYIPEINTIIEWDGIQHFEYIEHFHRKIENYHERQHYDCEKTKICIRNNIKLIRMDYTCYNNSYSKNLSFIKDALNSDKKVIFSNEEMYEFIRINL